METSPQEASKLTTDQTVYALTQVLPWSVAIITGLGTSAVEAMRGSIEFLDGQLPQSGAHFTNAGIAYGVSFLASWLLYKDSEAHGTLAEFPPKQ